MEAKRVKLGIMEAVEEAGVDHLLSDRESTPGRLFYENPLKVDI